MKKIFYILIGVISISCGKENKDADVVFIDSKVDYRINDIYFIDENIGFAIGGDRFTDGYILKTNDGGEIWNKIEDAQIDASSPLQTLNGIDFLNDSIGEIVGHGGKIVRTSDGGKTWEAILNGTWENFYDVALLSEDKSVIIAGAAYNKGKIFNSKDFWYSFEVSETPYALRSLVFLDDLLGYSVGYGYVNKTVDGGKTWTLLDVAGDYFFDLDFVNKDVGYVCGWEGGIFKTIDGGESWETIHGVNQAFSKRHHFENIDFFDENIGIVCGYNGEVLYTENGGEKWFSIETNTDTDFHSVCLLNENTAFAGGEEGFFLKLNL